MPRPQDRPRDRPQNRPHDRPHADSRGRLLRPPSGGAFRFDSGAVCLDFAHTGGEGEHAVFETLHTPDDLAAWLVEPPLVVPRLDLDTDDLRRARRIRTALWRAAHARAHGRPLPRDARRQLNAAAARPPLVPRLTPAGDRQTWAPPILLDQVLSTFAREMIDVLTGPFAGRVRECASDDCQLLFVDTSRPGRRRWCAMARCGNRHKVRTHRARIDA